MVRHNLRGRSSPRFSKREVSQKLSKCFRFTSESRPRRSIHPLSPRRRRQIERLPSVDRRAQLGDDVSQLQDSRGVACHLALMLVAHPIFSVADGFAKASPTTFVRNCLLARMCCLMTASSRAVSDDRLPCGRGSRQAIAPRPCRLSAGSFVRVTLAPSGHPFAGRLTD